MASWVVIGLDTTAPAVILSVDTPVTPGEVLVLGYTSDEPLGAAWLVLADGRTLALNIGPSELTLDPLPDAATAGLASVRVSDLVGNQTTVPDVLTIPPGISPPALPQPAWGAAPTPLIERRLVESRSVIVITDLWTLDQGSRSSTSRLTSVASATLRRSSARRLSTLSLTAGTQTNVTHQGQATGHAGSTWATERRDGPDEEAAMVLIGIL